MSERRLATLYRVRALVALARARQARSAGQHQTVQMHVEAARLWRCVANAHMDAVRLQ